MDIKSIIFRGTLGEFWVVLVILALWGIVYALDNKARMQKGFKGAAIALSLAIIPNIVQSTGNALSFSWTVTQILMVITFAFGVSISVYIIKKIKIFGLIGFGGIIALAIFFGTCGIILSL